YRMLRLGKEQPALDDKTKRRAQHSEKRGEKREQAEKRRRRRQHRDEEPGDARDKPESQPMLTGDSEAHFLEQIIFLSVGWLKHPHPAARAEPCSSLHRARPRSGIDDSKIALLEPPGDGRC